MAQAAPTSPAGGGAAAAKALRKEARAGPHGVVRGLGRSVSVIHSKTEIMMSSASMKYRHVYVYAHIGILGLGVFG